MKSKTPAIDQLALIQPPAAEPASLKSWALVELYGHQRIVGHVTFNPPEFPDMLRVDVPDLLKDGKVSIDAEAEGFPASFYAKRHPRTAMGRTSDGDVWMVAVDGRQEISVGATLDELAKVMQRLGCTDAVNLDGGGSTCMHLMGVTVNRPSDGVERPVSNGVMVFGPKLPIYKGDLKIVLPPKISLTAQSEAHLTLDGATVPNADVIWGAQGAAWIDQGGTIHPLETGKVKIKACAYGQVLSLVVAVVEKIGKSKAARRRARSDG